MIERLSAEFNVVLIDTGNVDAAANSVAWDNSGMGRGIGQGLIKQGCTSILFVAQAENRKISPTDRLRSGGLKAETDEAGVSCSLHFTEWDWSDLTPERSALVTPLAENLYPMLSRLNVLSFLSALRMGGLATQNQLELLPRGVYAVSNKASGTGRGGRSHRHHRPAPYPLSARDYQA